MPDAQMAQDGDRAARAGRLDLRRFLPSVMPALDLAFAAELVTEWPEDLAALIARLEAGPLGVPRVAALEDA